MRRPRLGGVETPDVFSAACWVLGIGERVKDGSEAIALGS